MALSKIRNDSLEDTAVHGRRNLIINGAMQVFQRGGSLTGTQNATYLVDRFQTRASAGSLDVPQSTTAPAGFTTSLKVAVNTTNDMSGAATDEVWIGQQIEALNLQHLEFGTSGAKTFTLSFSCRSNTTGNYAVWIYQEDGTIAQTKQFTINSADTWERKTLTYTGNTGNTIDNNNGAGFYVRWMLDGGSDRKGTIATGWSTSLDVRLPSDAPAWQNGSSNDFYLTGVQLELGDVATPFEHRSYGEELSLCQRYFQKIICINSMVMRGATSAAYSNAGMQSSFSFLKEMRSTPTMLNEDGSQTVTGDGRNVSYGTVANYEFELAPLGSQIFNYNYDQNNGNTTALPTSVAFVLIKDNCTADAEL